VVNSIQLPEVAPNPNHQQPPDTTQGILDEPAAEEQKASPPEVAAQTLDVELAARRELLAHHYERGDATSAGTVQSEIDVLVWALALAASHHHAADSVTAAELSALSAGGGSLAVPATFAEAVEAKAYADEAAAEAFFPVESEVSPGEGNEIGRVRHVHDRGVVVVEFPGGRMNNLPYTALGKVVRDVPVGPIGLQGETSTGDATIFLGGQGTWRCIICSGDVARYEGGFTGGEATGHGIILGVDGKKVYEGAVQNGKPEGMGTRYLDGEPTDIGMWQNGNFQG
jgi:hypothetical protein